MQANQVKPQKSSLIAAILAGILFIVGVSVFFALSGSGSEGSAVVFPDASPERGKRALVDYGCTGCHMVPGVRGADALVGPPLTYWADREYIAGRIRNTPDNLVSWIMAPQSIAPGSAMPDMGVTWGDARDIAAYLLTLRQGR